MSLPVILRPLADADVRDAHADLEAVRIGARKQFSADIRKLLERLEAFPELYGLVWKNVRAVRVGRRMYVAYFIVHADRVEVIAVIHGSRAASAWRSRM